MEDSVFDDYGDSEDFEPVAIVSLPDFPCTPNLRVFSRLLRQLHQG